LNGVQVVFKPVPKDIGGVKEPEAQYITIHGGEKKVLRAILHNEGASARQISVFVRLWVISAIRINTNNHGQTLQIQIR
jgi:hypothetical protein